MDRIKHFLSLFLRFPKKAAPPDAETLRLDFQDRHRAFRLLLAANRKALGTMAEMEERLLESHFFGMPFIRSRTTAVCVSVYKMIQLLDRLSRGKYRTLFSRYDDIEASIERLLADRIPETAADLVIPFSAIHAGMAAITGGKMASLGDIKQRLGIASPDGFVVTTAAYDLFVAENDLQAEIDSNFQSLDPDNTEQLYRLCSNIQQHILNARLPGRLATAMLSAFEQLAARHPEPLRLAMRSSALGEDAGEHSFAGQYRSALNVGRDSMLQAYREVLASKYSLQAVSYRLKNGIRDDDTPMCVGCMVMIPARSGGVVYTCNPVDPGDDSIYINSVWGLPKAVVDGTETCDLTVVSRGPSFKVTHSQPAEKSHQFICLAEEGCARTDLDQEQRSAMSIDAAQACALAELAVRIESHFAIPQDIEWAIDASGGISILQCRPLANQTVRTKTVPIRHPALIENEGVTAAAGVAAGTVVKVSKSADLLTFPDGAVLLVRQALPQWASLLGRACAVITEQGGFAGHLASVAREFGVPALFGVQGVMDCLDTGQSVTVDAGSRAVYAGCIAATSSLPAPPSVAVVHRPIADLLKAVTRHIVPLNLLDPDAVDFAPINCNTLHDITRFVHEKAVHEMFRFGKEHDFSERSSKQLYDHVPMQWWVLNLDDGFASEVTGKYVKLENIRSIPMLAFWKGYIAVPWEGPPAIDGKGLMAVMFQSTMNPALTPGLKSKYADRNYFIISKNYCSLTSRLGYHYASMEAMVSDRVSENYVSFQFKGGAADYERRLKRVRFIGDILEKNSFRVEIREDNLIAKVEAYEKDFISNRIAVLGYLALHSRQLDMIMENAASVAYYKKTIEGHIRNILNRGID